ncbi:hypothetical protein GGR77_004061 [Xanthomonas translucens]
MTGGDRVVDDIAGWEDRVSAQAALTVAKGDPRFSPDAEAVEERPLLLG